MYVRRDEAPGWADGDAELMLVVRYGLKVSSRE